MMMACRVLLVSVALGCVSASRLRNATRSTLVTNASALSDQKGQCKCKANSPAWKPTGRTVPKCVFIDLGAADGNTFRDFLANKYGPVGNCPSGQWEAFLVEANPHFNTPLQALAAQYPGQVHAMPSTAAYQCKGETSFFIDTDPTHNHWGSSMSSEHPDAVRSGKQKVTVPTLNVAELIAENVIPGDWVMLKVDIEGAEYDVVPCLAQSPKAKLVDRMYLEEHTWINTGSKNGPPQMAAAKQQLKADGVDIPDYFSQTF